MNKSIKKCCICSNSETGEFIMIGDNKYHLSCIEKMQKEKQELKEQLEEKNDFINKLQATKDRLDKYDYERTNQQKEFIEYLKSEIKRLEENNIYEPLQRTALATFQHVLSKYKEIIGGKHE